VVIGGISRGKACAGDWSMEGLPVRGSGETSFADVARLGASEMIPQPWEADDNNAAIRIKALTRHSKTAAWAKETDLGNGRCMGHREEYIQQ